MGLNRDIGKVVVVGMTESFLAKSLVSKLEEENIKANFSLANIKDLERYTSQMELVVLFLSEVIKKEGG